MAAKLTRMTHKIAIQLHLAAESCTVSSSRSRWPVRKLLNTPSHATLEVFTAMKIQSHGLLGCDTLNMLAARSSKTLLFYRSVTTHITTCTYIKTGSFIDRVL
jgi:hypothetical protein